MFKKILFVFVLAAAILAFAGYSVPTASACSTSVPDDCRPIFGPNFDAIQSVNPPLPSPLANSPDKSTEIGPLQDQQTAPSQPAPLITPPCSAAAPGC